MQGFQHRPYGDLRHGLGHQPEPLEMFPGYFGTESAGPTQIPISLLQDVVVTRETTNYILEHADREPDVPWFVCAGYSRPHSPFTAPSRYLRYYKDKTPPVERDDALPGRLEPFARQLYDKEGMGKLTPAQDQYGREAYYACIDFVDDCIGELLNTLDAAGQLDNTIIIYSSDHGEMAGAHGIWGKVVYHEPSVGVPLLMTGPGIRAGHHRVAHPISLMDLYPTTCGLAGLPIPEGLDGVDFSGVLADPAGATPPREYAPCATYLYGTKVKHKEGPKLGDTGEPNRAWRLARLRRSRRM